jgi:DNA-binding HxlR family transcriptional regulator
MEEANILIADCPARTTLALISGTWSVTVIYALRDGAKRHGELADQIGGISNKMLAQTLRRLQRHGLLSRQPGPGRQVRYELSDVGQSLLGPIAALARWACEHADTVATAVEGEGTFR